MKLTSPSSPRPSPQLQRPATSARVLDWLSRVDTPAAPGTGLISVEHTRKRPHNSRSRSASASTSQSSSPSQSSSLSRSRPISKRRTKRRKKLLRSTALMSPAPSSPAGKQGMGPDDMQEVGDTTQGHDRDMTPRAPRHDRGHSSSTHGHQGRLVRRTHDTAFGSDLDVSSVSSGSGQGSRRRTATSSHARSSAARSTTTGSRSSAKVSALLALIEFVSVPALSSDASFSLPPELSRMVGKLHAISGGIKTVPCHLRSAVEQEQALLWNPNWEADPIDDPSRHVTLTDVIDLVTTSNEYQATQESEAAWNCFVHARLGHLALRQSKHGKNLRFSNVTTSRIDPQQLLPSGSDGLAINSKIIDFAISLRPSQAIKSAFSRLEPVAPSGKPSFNQATHGAIARTPIAVSIETKAAGEGLNSAHTQLATWLLAHFARLRRLLSEAGKTDTPMPFLPFFVAQGPMWSFGAAYMPFYPPDHPIKERPMIMCDFGSIGDSRTRAGVCRIIAALEETMRWAEEDYRPWFEKNALPPIPLPHT